ncbi:MAG: hypothetical protein GWM98_10715 [Nitrospinaceae bacterium]|nr:hypothetical protein [Nitrospinaceae bacterium]NIW05969.1 hypothetical protein [Nitrospinaceae bacterium]NIX34506.1 hypothetical protein [Nitrospinaceae bacterium]NIY15326.1 hypothetical protein [Nitrospinaceae bacterium]
MFLAVFCMVGGSADRVQAFENSISLKASMGEVPLQVVRNREFRLNNAFTVELKNLSVIRLASGKRILSIRTFAPHQSINLEFTREGSYVLCFSWGLKGSSGRNRCVPLNVVVLQRT